MEIKIKLIHPDAILPSRQSDGAIGYDLVVPEDIVIDQRRKVIPLGFALELPHNVEAKIEPRSGFSAKGIEGCAVTYVCNGYDENGNLLWEWRSIGSPRRFDADALTGKIDPDYRGEVCAIIRNNDTAYPFMIAKGTRIAQMTFYRTETADFCVTNELTETQRADGGFGHTGAI